MKKVVSIFILICILVGPLTAQSGKHNTFFGPQSIQSSHHHAGNDITGKLPLFMMSTETEDSFDDARGIILYQQMETLFPFSNIHSLIKVPFYSSNFVINSATQLYIINRVILL